jgi:nucleoside-diphosphate-sugar epimerase
VTTGQHDDQPMLTLIVGRTSNLSERLSSRLQHCVRIPARNLTQERLAPLLPNREYQLIINSFQPATQLQDLSNPVDYVDLSIGVTARVLDAIAGTKCIKLIYTSSASVYGDNVDCKESSAPCATELHSGLKLANEQLVARACQNLGIDATIVRLFNMYGGQDRFSVIAKILAAIQTGAVLTIANDGNAVRDFIHIDDVVHTYEAVLHARGVPVLNVASGVGVSVRTILDALHYHGHNLATRSRKRDEIRVSTADVDLLSGLIDCSKFTSVIDYVLMKAEGSSSQRPGQAAYALYRGGRL